MWRAQQGLWSSRPSRRAPARYGSFGLALHIGQPGTFADGFPVLQEDYFGKIASRISAFSKRMANKPAAAGTGQAPAPVCLPLQTQTQQPRPYFQQQVLV